MRRKHDREIDLLILVIDALRQRRDEEPATYDRVIGHQSDLVARLMASQGGRETNGEMDVVVPPMGVLGGLRR